MNQPTLAERHLHSARHQRRMQYDACNIKAPKATAKPINKCRASTQKKNKLMADPVIRSFTNQQTPLNNLKLMPRCRRNLGKTRNYAWEDPANYYYWPSKWPAEAVSHAKQGFQGHSFFSFWVLFLGRYAFLAFGSAPIAATASCAEASGKTRLGAF